MQWIAQTASRHLPQTPVATQLASDTSRYSACLDSEPPLDLPRTRAAHRRHVKARHEVPGRCESGNRVRFSGRHPHFV